MTVEKKIITCILSIFLYLISTKETLAIYDPSSVPNNKIGIHILFVDEVDSAAKIVNGKDGEWGYVTIPIQASDRDRVKWQRFLDNCKQNKIIPIIRVATFTEGINWVVPNNFDLVDFANFLGDLTWPTANRYVIIFNEVNRSDEYGGYVSPEKYSDTLYNAINIFKEKSEDFFILPAGLDNAATNSKTSLNWRLYIERMYLRHPDIFDRIDGWTSHAYPNPDFSARPERTGNNKIDSFRYDLKFIRLFTTKKLPIFITETGWSSHRLSESQIAIFYEYALTHQWKDSDIVAITPFLLNAQDGPFSTFSFKKTNDINRVFADTITSFATKGEPIMGKDIDETIQVPINTHFPNIIHVNTNNSKSVLQKLYNSLQSLINIFGK